MSTLIWYTHSFDEKIVNKFNDLSIYGLLKNFFFNNTNEDKIKKNVDLCERKKTLNLTEILTNENNSENKIKKKVNWKQNYLEVIDVISYKKKKNQNKKKSYKEYYNKIMNKRNKQKINNNNNKNIGENVNSEEEFCIIF